MFQEEYGSAWVETVCAECAGKRRQWRIEQGETEAFAILKHLLSGATGKLLLRHLFRSILSRAYKAVNAQKTEPGREWCTFAVPRGVVRFGITRLKSKLWLAGLVKSWRGCKQHVKKYICQAGNNGSKLPQANIARRRLDRTAGPETLSTYQAIECICQVLTGLQSDRVKDLFWSNDE